MTGNVYIILFVIEMLILCKLQWHKKIIQLNNC